MTETIALAVADSRMAALFARPDAAGPHPAVLVTHHRGGLDAFLLQARDNVLSAKALRLKRAIAKKVAKAA